MKRKNKENGRTHHKYSARNYYCMSLWSQKENTSLRASSVEKNTPYIFMKIKNIFLIFSVIVALLSGLSFAEEDCSFYDKDDGYVAIPKGSFDQLYSKYLCEETNPINAEAVQYVQSIKKMKWKTVLELNKEIGDKFCYAGFGECSEKSFYNRYVNACKKANARATKEIQKPIGTDDKLFKDCETNWEVRAEVFVIIYMQVAAEELARYHGRLIQSSTKKYLEKTKELIDNLSNVMNTFLKKIGNISNQFEGYTRTVYNTWFTVGNSGH